MAKAAEATAAARGAGFLMSEDALHLRQAAANSRIPG